METLYKDDICGECGENMQKSNGSNYPHAPASNICLSNQLVNLKAINADLLEALVELTDIVDEILENGLSNQLDSFTL